MRSSAKLSIPKLSPEERANHLKSLLGDRYLDTYYDTKVYCPGSSQALARLANGQSSGICRTVEDPVGGGESTGLAEWQKVTMGAEGQKYMTPILTDARGKLLNRLNRS